ncbi:hypothetical protein ACHAXT_006068 [Thalassiosira profunda]
MKSSRLLGSLVLFASFSTVQSFVAQHSIDIAATRLVAQQDATLGPLFLHVEALHPHRDSVVRLDDPIAETDEKKSVISDEKLHSFNLYHLAPMALALYVLGQYLSSQNVEPAALLDGTGNIVIDPMFGGYVLIGAGLYLMKWSIDNAFLSPA